MREFSPIEVLDIFAARLDDRADALVRISLPGFDATIFELRRFAEMIRKARDYLQARK